MAETIVTVERDMAAPAEQVWSMISDVTRMGEWSPEAVGADWLGDATGPAVLEVAWERTGPAVSGAADVTTVPNAATTPSSVTATHLTGE